MALESNQLKDSNFENDQISTKDVIRIFKEIFTFLVSKWKFIILVSILGALIGVSIAIFDKPYYKAVLSFAMDEDKSSGGGGLSGALGLASSFGIDLGSGAGGAFAASNIAELMKSRIIIDKVLLKPIQIEGLTTTLAEYYIKINNIRETWNNIPALKLIKFSPNLDRSKFSRQQDSILKRVYIKLIDKERLSIMQKDKKVTILYIEVTSENELFSKLFCENLAEETSSFYIQTKSKKARINTEVLKKQVDSVKDALNLAINGVASEADNVYNLNPAFNIKGAKSKKRQIDVQANTVILTNLTVQYELAKITLRKETPLIQLIDRPVLPLDKAKLGKLNSLILGGFIAGFLSVLYLTLSNYYKKYF
jgi:hypothetical protein